MNERVRITLEEKRSEIITVCRKYGVASLDLFGSGASGDWKTDESDLDFIVSLRAIPDRSIADRYLGLAEDLEALLGRPVDLITSRSIRNPYFRRSVDATRQSVYAE